MPFDLHLTISDYSRTAQVMQRVAAAEHITPEQAAQQLLDEGAKWHGKKPPGEEMIGLFSSDEDVALIDEVMQMARERRKVDEQITPHRFG